MGRIVIGRIEDLDDDDGVESSRVVIGYMNGGFVSRAASSSSYQDPQTGFLPIFPAIAIANAIGKKKKNKAKDKEGGKKRIKLGERLKMFGKKAKESIRRLTRHDDEPEIIDVESETVAQVGALLVDTDGMRRRI